MSIGNVCQWNWDRVRAGVPPPSLGTNGKTCCNMAAFSPGSCKTGSETNNSLLNGSQLNSSVIHSNYQRTVLVGRCGGTGFVEMCVYLILTEKARNSSSIHGRLKHRGGLNLVFQHGDQMKLPKLPNRIRPSLKHSLPSCSFLSHH